MSKYDQKKTMGYNVVPRGRDNEEIQSAVGTFERPAPTGRRHRLQLQDACGHPDYQIALLLVILIIIAGLGAWHLSVN